ncbi:alpha/beta hydrolase [Carboxylicivirga sediminis]|uniref:Alpha/beta hydrolase n=1 Tax=Carboxylicivirga sediminis TaxID=2006564 RepID=A0A941F5V0_9BACT|nr:alpha/beta hydrolase [Carboxylicivirga sediminis]MBR8536468.1 alpha/beta hydrolase [Carboxylicivirga sediminis]
MKNSLFVIGLLVLSVFQMFSQKQVIDLWEGSVPFSKGLEVEEQNVDYRVSRVTVPQLYHYPAKGSEARPAIIIVPGGGYALEAIDHEGFMAAEWFNQQGFEAFVLKYRLPDDDLFDNPAFVPLMDAQQAIYLVRSRAKEFDIDPTRVGIIGFSAGGHLAASASTLFTKPVDKERTSEEVRPDFSVLMYPVISMDTTCTHIGSRQNLIGDAPEQDMVEYFSLEKQVSEQTPVTLLVHSLDDNAVPVENTYRYANNLFENGGDVTKVILPIGGHGFGFDAKRPVAYWTQYLGVWLKSNVMK